MALVKIRNPEYTAINGQEEWLVVNQVDDNINKDSVNAISNKAVAEALEEYIKEDSLATLNTIKSTDNSIPVGQASGEWKSVQASAEANANEVVLRNNEGHIILPTTDPQTNDVAASRNYVDKKANIQYNFTTQPGIPTVTVNRASTNNYMIIFQNTLAGLTISCPQTVPSNSNSSYITGIQFTTAEGFVGININPTQATIIPYPLNIGPNETWELNIMNNIVLGYKIT